jgi:mRNA interferase MazF
VKLPLTFNPKKGALLLCDFSRGFEEPEMTKNNRPVVVIGVNETQKLVTIVPLSTVEPKPVQPYHFLIPKQSMPKTSAFLGRNSWLKGNMVYTVGWKRLSPIRMKTAEQGTRDYFKQKFGPETMQKIYVCMINGMGINKDLLSKISCEL